MSEAVNHPQHYQKEGRKECIAEMKEKFGAFETCVFALLSAYKYLYRAGEKAGNSKQQDIAKALWYMQYVGKYKKEEQQFSIDEIHTLLRLLWDVNNEYSLILQEVNDVES